MHSFAVMITTRIRILAALTAVVSLGACAASKKPVTLDLVAASSTPEVAAIALVSQPDQGPEILAAAGIADPARQALIMELVPEVLADLSLFGADATARPRDVRIVVLGDGASDAVTSQRALPLYRTLGEALAANALRRLDVADRVLESRIAVIAADAVDQGREVNGATLTVVLKSITHDGDRLLLSGE
ncbi:MAG: hypothetical protein AAF557_18695 [Pseudomonadota bacterium]